MGTILIKNVTVVVTMDDAEREIKDGGILVRDHLIERVGPMGEMPAEETVDQVVDLHNHVVLPGLINTHHHLYQSLTRVQVQEGNLFRWLKTLYPIWAGLTDAGLYTATLTGCAELLLSGCTTCADHHYIFPNDVTLDSQIRAAQEIGIRFHASRGSMSLGESEGGLPPDSLVEEENAILKDTVRLIETYHNPERYALTRIVVAPCSPFSVSQKLMRASAELARSYDQVYLHTHLAETLDEEQFCRATYGVTPVELMDDLGWLGDDVWHAHCVHLSPEEVAQFGQTGTGVAHCPTSNMRLGSGISPLLDLLGRDVRVGLGVDGSASNDGGHLLGEARQMMLLQRVAHGAEALTARQALRVATRGGADVLGRDDIGQIAPGKCADLCAINLDQLPYAGAWHDPVAAVLFCQPQTVDYTMVHGRFVVEKGALQTVDLVELVRSHNRLAAKLFEG